MCQYGRSPVVVVVLVAKLQHRQEKATGNIIFCTQTLPTFSKESKQQAANVAAAAASASALATLYMNTCMEMGKKQRKLP